jgi:glycosyltransferase involved in cell wall biosynthesis
MPEEPFVELSVVMPCLNEADTLETCIAKAQRAMREHQISGEIIVADNGSSDGSQAIAERMGVRLVKVPRRGYGSALMAGIEAARGEFITMGDADDSYDFSELPKFVTGLREGHELVQGCRLPRGGGRIVDGAMPFLHRWVGNPLLTMLARSWFKARQIHDIYCGMRGFTKKLYKRLNLRCTGMEFATEMIVKACLYKANITEVPITLHPDGRVSHPPHLRTFRDGWRTLRFFLIYSPRRLFLIPGGMLVALGLIGYVLALPGLSVDGITFEMQSLLFSSLFILCGYQSIQFALFTKTVAMREGLLPEDPRIHRFFELVNLEKALVLGFLTLLAGIVMLIVSVYQWKEAGFGWLNYNRTMRWVIPGSTLCTLGFQTVLGSFFVSILGLSRR